MGGFLAGLGGAIAKGAKGYGNIVKQRAKNQMLGKKQQFSDAIKKPPDPLNPQPGDPGPGAIPPMKKKLKIRGGG